MPAGHCGFEKAAKKKPKSLSRRISAKLPGIHPPFDLRFPSPSHWQLPTSPIFTARMNDLESCSHTPMDVDPADNGGQDTVNPSPSLLTSPPPPRSASRITTRKRVGATSSRRPKAPTIPDDEWDRVKEHVVDLYGRQNLTLSDVAKKMKRDHGFDAT